MPRLRRCGGTNTPAATSTTVRSPITMRPPSALSSPATQRSVVVLPQPEGPSSVTTSPGADLEIDAVDGRDDLVVCGECLRQSLDADH